MVRGQAKEIAIHIRIGDAERQRIDHAARATGTTRSAFMLAAALARADEVILDRVHYAWPDAAMAAFRAALDEPPAPAPRAVAAERKPYRGVSLRAPEPLSGHDGAGFDCGVEALNVWLRRAPRGQRLSATFVAADDGGRIMAFYCLSAASVRSATAGPWVRGTAPEPLLKLGRLAVDRTMQGRGLGTALVLDAFARTYAVSRHASVAALVADAPDAGAAGWLTGLGFQPVSGDGALFVPLGTIEALVERHGRAG